MAQIASRGRPDCKRLHVGLVPDGMTERSERLVVDVRRQSSFEGDEQPPPRDRVPLPVCRTREDVPSDVASMREDDEESGVDGLKAPGCRMPDGRGKLPGREVMFELGLDYHAKPIRGGHGRVDNQVDTRLLRHCLRRDELGACQALGQCGRAGALEGGREEGSDSLRSSCERTSGEEVCERAGDLRLPQPRPVVMRRIERVRPAFEAEQPADRVRCGRRRAGERACADGLQHGVPVPRVDPAQSVLRERRRLPACQGSPLRGLASSHPGAWWRHICGRSSLHEHGRRPRSRRSAALRLFPKTVVGSGYTLRPKLGRLRSGSFQTPDARS